MKKLLWFTAITFCTITNAVAQEQSLLSVSAGGYLGGGTTHTIGHSLQLKVAYHINRFSIGTGINYFNSGYARKGVDFSPPHTNTYENELREEYIFRNLMLPVMLSYHAPMGSIFEFIPSVGIGASYTTKAQFSAQSSDSSFFKHDITSREFESNFRKVNLWGIAALHLACNLNEQLALLPAPNSRVCLPICTNPQPMFTMSAN